MDCWYLQSTVQISRECQIDVRKDVQTCLHEGKEQEAELEAAQHGDLQ